MLYSVKRDFKQVHPMCYSAPPIIPMVIVSSLKLGHHIWCDEERDNSFAAKINKTSTEIETIVWVHRLGTAKDNISSWTISAITCHSTEIEKCSNPLMMRKVFDFCFKIFGKFWI